MRSGCRGRWFESSRPDQKFHICKIKCFHLKTSLLFCPYAWSGLHNCDSQVILPVLK